MIDRGGPISWPARSPDQTPLDYFLWGHVKSLVYEIPGDSEEDLLIELLQRRILDYNVLVIVCMMTWYVGTVYVLKSLVVISSPSCKWTQKNNIQ